MENFKKKVYDGEHIKKEDESAAAMELFGQFNDDQATVEEKRLNNAVRRVMEAFEKAKPRMNPEAAKETQQFLDERKWYKHCLQPSQHPCYRRMVRGGRVGLPENFYYPNLLVLQALWPGHRTVTLMAGAFGHYWGDHDIKKGPAFYPKLNDKHLELKLFRGEVSDIGVPCGRYDPSLDLDYHPGNRNPGKDYSESESESDSESEDEGEDDDDDENKDEEVGDNNQIESDDKEDDQEEIEFEKHVEKLRAQLQDLEKEKRNMQERKRKDYELKSQDYEKSSKNNKKKSEEYKQKSEDDKKNAEQYARKAREYAKKLEQSSTASNNMPALSGQKSADGRPAKRGRHK